MVDPSIDEGGAALEAELRDRRGGAAGRWLRSAFERHARRLGALGEVMEFASLVQLELSVLSASLVLDEAELERLVDRVRHRYLRELVRNEQLARKLAQVAGPSVDFEGPLRFELLCRDFRDYLVQRDGEAKLVDLLDLYLGELRDLDLLAEQLAISRATVKRRLAEIREHLLRYLEG